MSSTSKTQKTALSAVLSGPVKGLQVNGCRTPGCANFDVMPVVVPGYIDPNYSVRTRSGTHQLFCNACRRTFSLMAGPAVLLEVERLRTKDGAWHPGCPKPGCTNFGRPVTRFPKRYGVKGKTSSGRTRYRCKRCEATFVYGEDHRQLTQKRIHPGLVRCFTNAVTLNGQARVGDHDVNLEAEVLEAIQAIDGQALLMLSTETLDPSQFYGIELNPRAVPIADLVLWIGYLKWQLRHTGVSSIAEPILHAYGTIREGDAILSYSSAEEARDDAGAPILIRDGRTMKPNPEAPEQLIPDTTATVPMKIYHDPAPAIWPEVEFVIGTPPSSEAGSSAESLATGTRKPSGARAKTSLPRPTS